VSRTGPRALTRAPGGVDTPGCEFWQPADLPGYNLKPDPMAARSAADLIRALRDYRVWAGDVSFRALARKSGQLASASAMCNALGDPALSRNELPRLSVVTAVVVGCGGTRDDQAAWATAWRLLRRGTSVPIRPAV
jgi:hypothetical protein